VQKVRIKHYKLKDFARRPDKVSYLEDRRDIKKKRKKRISRSGKVREKVIDAKNRPNSSFPSD
jgi:hypothetical protein